MSNFAIAHYRAISTTLNDEWPIPVTVDYCVLVTG